MTVTIAMSVILVIAFTSALSSLEPKIVAWLARRKEFSGYVICSSIAVRLGLFVPACVLFVQANYVGSMCLVILNHVITIGCLERERKLKKARSAKFLPAGYKGGL